jgi:hypothetical protein
MVEMLDWLMDKNESYFFMEFDSENRWLNDAVIMPFQTLDWSLT